MESRQEEPGARRSATTISSIAASPHSNQSVTATPRPHRITRKKQGSSPHSRRHLLRPSHPSAHQAGPGWVGHNAQYPSPGGGTPAVQVPQRSRGFNQWRVQLEIWGTGGTRGEPAQHDQVRPAAPHKGRDVASASQDLQWAPGPGFFRARLRDSLIHQAGPAGGTRSPRTAARSNHALLRFTRQGPASMELTPQGGGAPPAPRPPQQDEERQQGPQESGHPSRSFPSPMLGAFRRGPWLQVMAAAPLPRFRLLRGRRSLWAEAPPKCPREVNEIFTPVYLSLGCGRAQDLNLLVGRERSSSVRRPLRQPS
ncbi:hypothetical protein NDU88_003718 [Pleurodeles waltl]|uniref:Uncharacterized protein n=1 Tax=Pleurodeles waltl TaxID=8319 RepID=A0AAV7SGQ4_PLEWA|nr:hypothetical protein NDU88_003718 [Pleurodeles waltl]